MDDRELRNRIQRSDPAGSGVETRSVSDESVRRMLENIVEQPVSNPTSGNRGARFVVAVAAVAALAFGAFAVFGNTSPAGPPLALSLGETNSISSCIQISADIMRDMPLAFAGTVTAVDGDKVTIDVDEWFKGGDAAVVELSAPQGMQALIDGIDFEVGGEYLITASEGTVNYCGFSGPATPELRAVFDEAFPG